MDDSVKVSPNFVLTEEDFLDWKWKVVEPVNIFSFSCHLKYQGSVRSKPKHRRITAGFSEIR